MVFSNGQEAARIGVTAGAAWNFTTRSTQLAEGSGIAGPITLPPGQQPGSPLTALAPMQDVTDLAFMGVIAHYGAPDYFFTEFFRVHAMSRPEKHILRSIDENATGRPVGSAVPEVM